MDYEDEYDYENEYGYPKELKHGEIKEIKRESYDRNQPDWY